MTGPGFPSPANPATVSRVFRTVLVKRRAVDLCRVDSCLCPSSAQ